MAAPETTNPYAAPSAINSPATGPSHLWQIDGIGLLVAHSAVLPKIDLESGSEDPSLVEVRRKFVKAHWSMGFMGLLAMMFQFIPKPLRSWDGHRFWISLIVFFGVWLGLYLLIHLTLSRRVRFTTYVQPAAEARRKRNRNIRGVIYSVSIAFMISPLVLLYSDQAALPDTNILLIIGVIGVIACVYWQYQTRPKIHMTLESNGWLRLGGVHSSAIRRLEAWREEHREAP
ncbi:hypothetical protein OVA24_18325 [Luteolibacter sp. SL250]|uniref:hypothetical protein n=1 Tax=Luteolibacter sp. SL250 TaxID=2995170 RepID=UPI00226D6866|nr:hypothetical protein [Luteolibacter sp. SL250]WAC19187.1 hypothetical protein OVA24_18325 [Luteolibacter sp. SL250]